MSQVLIDRALLEQALEALGQVTRHFTRTPSSLADSAVRVSAHDALHTLRAALAQEEQEPLSADALARELVTSRIIDPAAIDDPVGYDGGMTLARVLDLHRRLAALEQEEQEQEPVAWIDNSEHPKHRLYWQSATEKRLYGPLRPLYTAPPRREWKGLTEEEREAAIKWAIDQETTQYSRTVARAIEQALKEKNNG